VRDRKMERLFRRASLRAARRVGFATRAPWRPTVGRPRTVVAVVVATAIISVLAGPVILLKGKRGAAAAAVTQVPFTPACSDTSAGGNQVEVTGPWGGTEQVRFRSVLERFSRESGIQVTFATGSPDSDRPDREVAATLERRLANGCAPDVALLPQPGLLADLAAAGRIKPLPRDTASLVRRNYNPAWLRLASYGGELYGVWFKASNKSMIWYRSEAFDRAGVEPPSTWSELMQVSESLAASGTTPFSIGGADGWTLTDWFENIYLRTAGPELYDKLARHEIPWTHPSVTQALATLAQVLGRPEWLAGGTPGALETGFEASVKKVFGDTPTAAMVYEGDFVATAIDGGKVRIGHEAKVFPFPSVAESDPAAVALGGDVAVLFNPGNKAAKRLIRFLATPEAAEPWAKLGGFTSPNKRLDPAVYPDQTTRESASLLARSEIVRFDLSDLQPVSFAGTTGQGMWRIFQDFLQHPTDVEATARALEAARRAADQRAAKQA
jgi:alpha-glucoside transport system substrate-binding protein